MDYSTRELYCPFCGWKPYPGEIIPGAPTVLMCKLCHNELTDITFYNEGHSVLPFPLNKFSPKMDRLYLASPYTSDNFLLMQTRYELSLFATALLTELNFEVYSPIVYTHIIAHRYKIKPDDSAFWVALDTGYINHWATGMVVLKLPGYQESSGISKEIQIAAENKMEIIYVNLETLYDITRALPSRLD